MRTLDGRDFEHLGTPGALVTDAGDDVAFCVTPDDAPYWREDWLHAVEYGWQFGDETAIDGFNWDFARNRPIKYMEGENR